MKMIRQLFPLAIGGVALGSTEFIPMGLMRTMGGDLHLSDDQVGNFIAAYAIGVVVGAPTLVGLSTRFQPKKVLIVFMLLFTLFNGLFSLMPTYETLLVTRFFSGLPHGAFFGVGAIVAKQLAPKDKEAMAISVMFGGLTIANLLVIPLFTHLGGDDLYGVHGGILVGSLTKLPSIQRRSELRYWVVGRLAQRTFRKQPRVLIICLSYS